MGEGFDGMFGKVSSEGRLRGSRRKRVFCSVFRYDSGGSRRRGGRILKYLPSSGYGGLGGNRAGCRRCQPARDLGAQLPRSRR